MRFIVFILIFVFLQISFCQKRNSEPKSENPTKAKLIKNYDFDLNLDGIVERFSLFGIPFDKKTAFLKKIYFTIKNKKMKRELFVSLPAGYESGYEPELSFYKIIFDNKYDIFYKSTTGSSGGIICFIVFSQLGNEVRPIFISAEKELKVKGEFLDGLRVRFDVIDYKQTYEIDLKERKDFYNENKIYNEDKLVEKRDVWVSGYSGVKIYDFDNDGTDEIEGTQVLKGIANYDNIANIISVWKFYNGYWQLIKVEVRKISDS